MRMIPLWLIVILLLLTSKTYATYFSEIYRLNERDLESFYLGGELSFRQYELLSDLYETGMVNVSSVTASSFELQDAFYTSMRIIPLHEQSRQRESARISPDMGIEYKARQIYSIRGESVSPAGFYHLGMVHSPDWSTTIDYKGNSGSPPKIYRRSLQYSGGGLLMNLTVGDFVTNFGLGLNVGRQDYANDISRQDYAGFWQVPSGKYNGGMIKLRIKSMEPWLLYSDKVYPEFRKTKFGCGLEHNTGNLIIGIVASRDRIRAEHGLGYLYVTNAGSYAIAQRGDNTYAAEFGLSADGGSAICTTVNFKNERFASRVSLWNYSKGYFNLSSGGITDIHENPSSFGDSSFAYSTEARDCFGAVVSNSIPLNDKLSFTNTFSGSGKGEQQNPSYDVSFGFHFDNGHAPNVRFMAGAGEEYYYDRPSKSKFAQGIIAMQFSTVHRLELELALRDRKLLDSGDDLKSSGKVKATIFFSLRDGLDLNMGAAVRSRVWISEYRNYAEIFVGENIRLFASGYLTLEYIARRGYGDSTAYVDLRGEF